MGMMFRLENSLNFLRFSVDSQRNYRRLVHCSDGVYSVIYSDATSYTPGIPESVRLPYRVDTADLDIVVAPGIGIFIVDNLKLSAGVGLRYASAPGGGGGMGMGGGGGGAPTLTFGPISLLAT